MPLRVRYRRSRRCIAVPTPCMAVAEARYAALQAERGYVEQLWSPRQWDAICDAFEADFTFLSHTDLSAVFRIRRHIQGRCVEVSVPVGLCLQATLRLESFLLDHPAAAAASVRKFLRDATLVGDDRCLPSRSCRSHLVVLFAAVPSGSASRLLPPLCKTWPLPPLLPFHCRPQPCPGVCLNCPRACRIWCCVCLAPLPCGRPAWPTSGHANVPGSSQNLQGHPHARAVRQRRDAALCDRTEKVCPPC